MKFVNEKDENVENINMVAHKRFNRTVWVFKKDFTGALAKWLVKLSPYNVPDNLEKIIREFHNRIPYKFDKIGMTEVNLLHMTEAIYDALKSMPDVMALNERKNGRDGNGFTSRYHIEPDPDDDFIDIMALAQNITCEFADKADANDYLNL